MRPIVFQIIQNFHTGNYITSYHTNDMIHFHIFVILYLFYKIVFSSSLIKYSVY